MPATLNPETIEDQRQEAIWDLAERYPASAILVQDYLDRSTRYTVGSYCTLTLAGKAKQYSVHYEDAMWNVLVYRISGRGRVEAGSG